MDNDNLKTSSSTPLDVTMEAANWMALSSSEITRSRSHSQENETPENIPLRSHNNKLSHGTKLVGPDSFRIIEESSSTSKPGDHIIPYSIPPPIVDLDALDNQTLQEICSVKSMDMSHNLKPLIRTQRSDVIENKLTKAKSLVTTKTSMDPMNTTHSIKFVPNLEDNIKLPRDYNDKPLVKTRSTRLLKKVQSYTDHVDKNHQANMLKSRSDRIHPKPSGMIVKTDNTTTSAAPSQLVTKPTTTSMHLSVSPANNITVIKNKALTSQQSIKIVEYPIKHQNVHPIVDIPTQEPVTKRKKISRKARKALRRKSSVIKFHDLPSAATIASTANNAVNMAKSENLPIAKTGSQSTSTDGPKNINVPVFIIPKIIQSDYTHDNQKITFNKYELDFNTLIKQKEVAPCINLEKLKYNIYYLNQEHQIAQFWPLFEQSLDNMEHPMVAITVFKDKISRGYRYQTARVRVIGLCTDDICFILSISGRAANCGITKKIKKDFMSRYILPPQIEKILADDNIIKIGCNAEQESLNIKNTFVNINGLELQIRKLYDIITRDQIKNKLKEPHEFKDMCHNYLQVNISKESGVKKWWVDELSIDQILYSAMDTIFCFMLRDI